MIILLKKHKERLKGQINLEASKSESNRALIINALAAGDSNRIRNLSMARDTRTMLKLLESKEDILDVKDAGTTMRFITAYRALGDTQVTVTGTDRMQKRPIGPLVNALREIGANIEYLGEEGYPPLKIKKFPGQQRNEISIPGNISSQYISALLMIAPSLPQGLAINLTTEVFSKPYIQMTLDLMKDFGILSKWKGNTIIVEPQTYEPSSYTIEGDWSGASYWYSFLALTPRRGYLNLPGIWGYSSQGDREIANMMYHLGVATHYESGKVKLLKRKVTEREITFDFRECPDLAQTVMVVAAAKGVRLEMTGLESLKIKETDRVQAMTEQIAKIGAQLIENGNKWTLIPSESLPEEIEVDTYEDHRMAMAFAPLCQLMNVTIHDPMVVDKSYPGFWEELKGLGVEIQEK